MPDQKWYDGHSKDYMPVICPGFSWHHLHDGKAPAKWDQIPRLKGRCYWTQANAAKAACARMFYVAMFDEMDEGRAIFKRDPQPPVGRLGYSTLRGWEVTAICG